jgi:tetratricopeptide (TPR) repeat protein
MKKALLPVLLLVIMAAFVGAKKNYQPVGYPVFDHEISICGGGLNLQVQPGPDGKFIRLMPGTGHHHYPVKTSSDSSQIYFDQGLSFYYGYHFPEALASFKEAARFDGKCLMAYWGQALALGPYYNNYNYQMSSEVPAVLQMLQRANTGADAKENDLMSAMLQRYSADVTNADRKDLDIRYAEAMRQLMAKYPADNEMKLLYIDAVMLCHKWDFWNTDGTAKPWTPKVVSVCETVLKADPKNAAAIHYYIHLTEASRHPEVALRYADELKDLMPGVAHMVHMATHSYQRNGLFPKGVSVNETAYKVFNREDSSTALHLNKNNPIHFFAVQSYCAMSAGMYRMGMPIYLRAKERMAAMQPVYKNDPYAQFVYILPQIARVRLGKWDEILKEPRPDVQWKYARILDDFSKGMAKVHEHDLSSAKQYLDELKGNLSDSLLAVRRMPYNEPRQPARIAADILEGEILYADGKMTEAIVMLNNAVSEEDRMIYREPQEWFIPARQYLGYYLLKMKKPAGAEAVYRRDLMANPGNGWSLAGLYNAAKAQNKSKEATIYRAKYLRAFADADSKPMDSVY